MAGQIRGSQLSSTIILSGSFSGSFIGDGSGLTGTGGSTPTLQQITDAGSSTTTSITASIISASGDIVGNNLSGTNTGDQDLSNLVTNSSTASFAITGSNVIFGNITSSGNISASGDITASNINVSSDLTVTDEIRLGSGIVALDSNNLSGLENQLKVGTDGSITEIEIGRSTSSNRKIEIYGQITRSGNISASGDIFAHSGSFSYITASIIDVDGDTIRFGGEPFTRADIQTLKLGESLKPIRAGRSKPDVVGDDGNFEGNITSSGNISASNNIFGKNIFFSQDISGSINSSYFGDEYNAHGGDANSGFTLLSLGAKPSIFASGASLEIGNATNSTQTGIHLVGEVTASGNISASGDIIANKVTADVVDTSFETFLNFEAATAFTFIAPFAMTINFTGSSTGSMDVVDFVTASANTETFSIRQNPPITLNIFDKLKVTPSASGLFSFSGSRII